MYMNYDYISDFRNEQMYTNDKDVLVDSFLLGMIL